jgi:DNA repair ATPase RecN
MSARHLHVRRLARGYGKTEESLEFAAGVNVLVGQPNAGKTKWLATLDFLMGDNSTVEKALGEVVAEKYQWARAELLIGGEAHVIERNWKDGARTKTLLDGKSLAGDEFSAEILGLLGMPRVRIPKGNPYSGQTWPNLSWRMILRHLYRHEKSWVDLAANQPEPEQMAVLFMLIGAAASVYSKEYEELVQQQRSSTTLAAQKETFDATLQVLLKELVSVERVAAGFTKETLAQAVLQAEQELASREKARNEALGAIRGQASRASESPDAASRAIEELEQAQRSHGELESELGNGSRRLTEVKRNIRGLQQELGRLERAQGAGELLADLRVSHCPACDRLLPSAKLPEDVCHVCRRPVENGPKAAPTPSARIAFETDALREELKESRRLEVELVQEIEGLIPRKRDVEERIATLRRVLQPVAESAAWMIPPELGVMDREIGVFQERLNQLERVGAALARRDALAGDLDESRKRIAELQSVVAKKESAPDYTTRADALADAMADYLNALDSRSQKRWGGQRVSATASDAAVRFFVESRPWASKLGANLTAYFLLNDRARFEIS